MIQDKLQQLVDEQAEDEGLWFNAETAPEAYLQRALRRLHAKIENRDGDDQLKTDVISDAGIAKQFLLKYMNENFKDKYFKGYIKERLADDFAIELANAIRTKKHLDKVVTGDVFDSIYKEYIDELAGISYMATGITTNVIQYENDRKEAMKRLIRKLICCID